MYKVPYASVIVCFMHEMVYNRPKKEYVMRAVSWIMTNLGKNHWEEVKWIFRYLRGTENSTL